ncbi:hypothetical protein PACTADRAFT_42018 [Pachysolen tannophilus NRRL Y-2460]|uniref:W2 domain-containing protein n=1 Tax=Pachysolen tannophilus NRRL Y-2460 TaxID=669874 RepID=A0A1E4TUF2_PACTA|nr:hypothetical protein PACTADRAFT_42018 [Pachysolen tannophilus NRRL Y-2460]
MSFINICRDNTDPFYRYKMPPIQSKIEGRGNGIKTAVVNASEVARALDRPSAYIIKYFGIELGAQTSINEATERYLVNGQHDSNRLQELLDGFINKFVLCGACKNPETAIIINKDDTLTRNCKACGKKTLIDPRHKLNQFILKNQVTKSKKTKKSATATANVVGGGVTISDLASGQKTSSRGGLADDSQDSVNQDEEFSDDDELARKINAEAQALPEVDPVKDDDWAVDMSEEAIARRAKELEGLSIDDAKKSLSKYEIFGEWLYRADKSDLPSDIDIYKKANELEIVNKSNTLTVLAQCLFDENIEDEITLHHGLLNKLITSDKHEKAFLGGLERLVGLDVPELITKVPKICMALYDNDLISEETFIKWGTTVSTKFVSDKKIVKKVKRAAKPFITWLQEAEEDEEENESNDDDSE